MPATVYYFPPASGAGGVGWAAQQWSHALTVVPDLTDAHGTTLVDSNTWVTTGSVNAPAQFTDTGGSVQFPGPALGILSYPGVVNVIKNPSTDHWYEAREVMFVDTPTAASNNWLVQLENATDGVSLKLAGATSTTVIQLLMVNAGGLTLTPCSDVGTVGIGITVGTKFTVALSFDGTTCIGFINRVEAVRSTVLTRLSVLPCKPDVASSGAPKINAYSMMSAWK